MTAPNHLTATSARDGEAPIRSLLVANRGEVAIRIIRACRDLGIHAVALVSDVDAPGLNGRLADEAVVLAGTDARHPYLDVERVVAAAIEAGVDAVHPGYGFLSERADFADAVTAAGIRFIGPTGDVLRALGDKRAARRLAAEVGVPILPGTDAVPDADLTVLAEVGFPLMVKAAHGGGGRGIRVVRDADALAEALDRARRESLLAFGRDEVFVERMVERPRHIEVQILGDVHGTVVHLGTRDCSTQRRHQKLVEEAPAASLSEATRHELCAAAVRLAEHVGYTGAGTVEFLVDQVSEEFWFLEVNTRLQVEHTVTELVTGIDIVRAQIAVAAGQTLGFAQPEVDLRGHAIQVRLNAEDPATGFLPSTGVLTGLELPQGPWVRCDSGLRAGDEISPAFDSLIAKVQAWGPTRNDAIARLARALDETEISGVATTRAYLRALLDHPVFVANDVWTDFIDAAPIDPTTLGGEALEPSTSGGQRSLTIATASGVIALTIPVLTAGGQRAAAAPAAESERDQTTRSAPRTAAHAAAPMDGILARYLVAVGDRVGATTTIAIVESMKMETEVSAGRPGVVASLRAGIGETVRRGAPLVEITADAAADLAAATDS